jgi:hypothetical protein
MVFLPPVTVQEIHIIGKGETSLILQVIHNQMGTRNRDPSIAAAEDLRSKPHGHQDRQPFARLTFICRFQGLTAIVL